MNAAQLAAVMMLTASAEPMVMPISRDPFYDIMSTPIRPSSNQPSKRKPKSKVVSKRRNKNKAARKARKK